MNFNEMPQETGLSRLKERDMDRLENEHPEVLSLLEELKNPNLSSEDFFGLVDDFYANRTEQPAATGTYHELRWDVEDVSGRSVKVKWFENGRLEISGTDNSE